MYCLFHDRLTTPKDRQLFNNIIQDEIANIFGYGHSSKEDSSFNDLIFGIFANDKNSFDQKYKRIWNVSIERNAITKYRDDTNTTFTHSKAIVLVDYTIEHIARIYRIITGFLVVVCGSGRSL